MSKRLINTGVAAAAAAVLAIGAYLLGSAQSDSTANTANTANSENFRAQNGQRPPGFGRGGGFGTEVTAMLRRRLRRPWLRSTTAPSSAC
jgi:hypothetical protein